jgi:hypothetical protein
MTNSKITTTWSQPWLLSTAFLLGLGLVIFYGPDQIFGLDTTRVLQGVMFATAMWAKRDAKALSVNQRKRSWGGVFATEWRVFWLIFLAWIVFLPMYISYRERLIDGRIPLLPKSTDDDPLGTAIDESQPHAPRTDFVILVHGTFAAPKQGVNQWYELADSDGFASKLHNRLRQGPLGDAVLKGSAQRFFWSGENLHDARLEGARKLCSLLLNISRENPSARIHLVGHSHGGNVILGAIRSFITLHVEKGRVPRTLGRVVFLGTPFYQKLWPKDDRFRDLLLLPVVMLWMLLWSILDTFLQFQYWLYAAGAAFVGWYWWKVGQLDLTTFYRGFEFWTWPSFAQTVVGCIVVASCAAMFLKLKSARPIDSNVYFDVNRFTCGPNYFVERATLGLWKPPLAPAIAPEIFVTKYQQIQRIKALVLTSVHFDEALLVLSAAPTLSKLIETTLRSTLRFGLPLFPRYDYANYGGGNFFGELIVYAGRVALWFVKFPIFVMIVPILRLTNGVYSRVTARLLAVKAKAFGFGLPKDMLSRWEVKASARIGVPLFFDECFTDVSREHYQPLLANAQSSRETEWRKEFGYIWDDELLRQRTQRADWLTRRGMQLNSSDTRIALTIEDRLRDLAQQVDLTHGTYYGVEDDCERIASFLEADQFESQSACLDDLRKLPTFGTRQVPTNFVLYLTLVFAGLKLWGKSPFVHWPWIAVLLPYLIGVGSSMLVDLKLQEKAAEYIRKAISSNSDDAAANF